MATYAELNGLYSNGDLMVKVSVACVIKAHSLLQGTPSADQKTIAKAILENPPGYAKTVIKYVLAANANATPTQITDATDSTVQTHVDAAINALVGV